MNIRALAALVMALIVLTTPVLVLADDSTDDPVDQLPDIEALYVRAARQQYDFIRQALVPLSSALASPGNVAPSEWEDMATRVYYLTEDLANTAPPTALNSIQGAHNDLKEKAYWLVEWASSFGGPFAGDASISYEEVTVQMLAMLLTETNEAYNEVQGALTVAEAGLELLVVARAEELAEEEAEQEEQVETATGLSDLFGISLDPWDYCFIATAAYGTAAAEEIDVLREFRDEVLLQCAPGQAFVDFYYEYSPSLAGFISNHELLRTAVREGFVDPIVWVVDNTRDLWEPTTAP